FALGELAHHQLWITAADFQNLVHSFFTRPRKNGADARGVPERDQRLSADGRFLATVEPQGGSFQAAYVGVKQGQVRVIGKLYDLHGNTIRLIGEISRYFSYHWVQSLFCRFLHLFVLPPRLRDMVIGQDASITHNKSRPEKILSHLRRTPFQ